MMPAMTTIPLKRGTQDVGEAHAAKFLKSGLPGTKTWVPTIVNPAPEGTTVQRLLWWGHILLHVVSLCLSGVNNFGAALLQAATSGCVNELWCFSSAPNGGMIALGISGGTCHVLSIVMILVAAAIWDAKSYIKMIWYHNLMLFFTNFALVCSLFVWASASARPHSVAFWLATPGVIIQVFSVAMLYSTSSAIGSRNLNRTFIFQLTLALDLMIALAWQTGTFLEFGLHIDPASKSMMWVAFGTQCAAQVMLLLGRIFTQSKLNVRTASKYPFWRSVFVGLLAISAIATSYRFARTDDVYQTIITSFNTPATILSYLTLAIAIAPDMAIAYPAKPLMDEEYDDTVEAEETEDVDEEEGEAIEARYRAPKLAVRK